MTADTPRRHSLPVAALDVLELVRRGVLDRFPATAPAGTVELGLGPATDDEEDRALTLTDLEGMPVARQRAVAGDGLVHTTGRPEWLGHRSSRPFEPWHRGPADVAGHSGVVVPAGPVDPESLAAALEQAGPRPLLLVLASLDGDLDPGALAAAQLGVAAVSAIPGADLAICPLPHLLDEAGRDTVVQAYAAGRPVHELPSTADLPADLPGDQLSTEPGLVVFLTGLSGSGKSTVARALRNRLLELGRRTSLLDGDLVRQHLSAGLGFSPADRDTNIRRIGWVAAEIAHHGGIAICSPIAPFDETRRAVRQMVTGRGGRFVLIHIATPLEECERRDRKGLYAAARRGEIPDFTGVSSPYQEPADADLRIDTTGRDVDEIVEEILAHVGRPHPAPSLDS